MATTPALPDLVQRFFTQHLRENKSASPQTINAYRDTFRLFFNFVHGKTGRSPSDLQISDIDESAVLAMIRKHFCIRAIVPVQNKTSYVDWNGLLVEAHANPQPPSGS